MMNDEMESVTDAEDWDAEGEQRGVGIGSIGVVDRGGSAGEDEADGLEGADFGNGRRTGEHDTEDVLLADAAGNELGILRAEVEDDNCLGVHDSVLQGAGRDVKKCGRWSGMG